MVIATCFDSHESSSGKLRTTEHFRVLTTVLFVSKAADQSVSSGSCTKTEGLPLLTHGSAAFEIKRTVSKKKCSVVLS
jgi:hypothetical protein